MSEFPALRANDYRDTWCGQVLADRVGRRARVAGWVHRRRDHGGLVFIDLRDRTGLVQLVFHPDEAGAAFELGHRLRAEDVISVAGEVVRRSEETINPELATGEFELRVAEAQMLADAETPPFEIESFSGEVGEEMRLRHRYLDLRREPMQRAVTIRAAVMRAIREFLDGEGFVEIETPMLSRSTPEGARDFLVPARREPGSFYALPQSPQLFKQLLMVAGFERYYQIVRCFRDEDQRADRQPDFTQLDIELSFVDGEDVIDVNERMLAHVFERVGGPRLELPIKRLCYHEAIGRFGTDRPDLRFGLELADLSDLLAETEFKVFAGALEGGGVVKGLNAGARELPRSALDGLIERARELGAKGLVWAFREGAGWRSPTAKFLSEAELAALNERLGAEEGDLLLVVADAPGDCQLRPRAASARPGRALRADRRLAERLLLDRPVAALRVERRRGALGPAAPSVHRARGRPRPGRPRCRPRAGLRPRLERPGARGRLDPYLRRRPPAARARGDRDRRGRGAGALRLPARRAPLRRAAPRRHRVRARPHRPAHRGRGLDPRRDRLPEGRLRRRPADRRAGAGGRRPAARARPGAARPPSRLKRLAGLAD